MVCTKLTALGFFETKKKYQNISPDKTDSNASSKADLTVVLNITETEILQSYNFKAEKASHRKNSRKLTEYKGEGQPPMGGIYKNKFSSCFEKSTECGVTGSRGHLSAP